MATPGTTAGTGLATGNASSSTKASTKPTPIASTARRQCRRPAPSRINVVLVVLSVLAMLAAAAVTVLVIERVTTPAQVDPELLPAAEAAYSAINSFDYTDVDGSVEESLAVLMPELRDQYVADLQDGIVPAYLEASATVRVDNILVGLQSINEEQNEAVVIAYGTKVTKSVNQQAPPAGSECAVTADGADACVLTQQLSLRNVDGTWLVSAVSTITTT